MKRAISHPVDSLRVPEYPTLDCRLIQHAWGDRMNGYNRETRLPRPPSPFSRCNKPDVLAVTKRRTSPSEHEKLARLTQELMAVGIRPIHPNDHMLWSRVCRAD